jgi:hypothetical protein
MANQTGKNLIIALKVEATLNTAPGDTGAEQLRLTASPGLKLAKARIQSEEIRPDGQTVIHRHGSRSVTGSYSGELSQGSFDTLLQAVMRSTAVAATTLTQADSSLQTLTFGTSTITADTTGAGGFIAAGLRVGDVFRVTGTSGANDDLNAQIRTLATNTLTVQSSAFTVDASVSTFSLTIGKKLANGATPTRRSFYVDQYDQDIDLSTVFGGVRWTGFTLRGTPDGMAAIEFNALGVAASALATGTSPYYTTPTTYTSEPLVFADAIIGLRGTDIAVATAFDLSYQITAATLPVIGSDITPDVFDNDARLTGSITILRQDLANLTSFIDEDELELMVMLQEPGTDPKAYVSFFVPKLKFDDNDSALGNDGARVDTIPWGAGLKASASGYDQTMLTICTDS